MLFEKRVGVHGKQDNALEKKRAGSTCLDQDGALSDDPSDDGSFPSSAIYFPRYLILESTAVALIVTVLKVIGPSWEDSVLPPRRLHPSVVHRMSEMTMMTMVLRSCEAKPDDNGTTCDCSQFNNTAGVGTFT
jgi:hypothetical protein